MRWVTRLRLRLRSLFRSGRVEQELDEELRYHLDRLVDNYLAAGMSPSEARYHAHREMGAIELRKEECRDARGLALVDSLRQDVTYALRALRKSPAFSVVAILSLAIGIGANTTIFTFVNAVLLEPLPYPGSERLVTLHEHLLDSAKPLSVHPATFVAWRARARSFEALALTQSPPLNVMGPNGAEQLSRMMMTGELFQAFGVRPALGRTFTEDELRPRGGPVVILGHGFWQRWFGGDPTVLGRQLTVPDGSLTIVGVGPPGFRIGVAEPDVFTPLGIDPANPAATGSRAFQAYGRLAAGTTLDAAQSEMSVIAAALRQQERAVEGMDVFVFGLRDFLVRDARPSLQLLMAVVASVLVIGCVNLAGLLLARGLARRGEFAVRAALGASRSRLVRQLVVESVVLSALGGLAGVVLAHWAIQALVALTAGALTVGVSGPVRLDAMCLFFTFAASIATAVAFGLVPAWQASHVNPEMALHERSRGSVGDRRHHRIRKLLVVTEVALAVVLLIGAGLLVRTFSSLVRVDLGFRPEGTVTMGMFLGVRPPEARIAALDRILDRVEQVADVKAAGTIQFLPLQGAACGTGFWSEAHATAKDPARTQPTECSLISRGYFAAMGIPVLQGRPFDERDTTAAPRVLVVNQSFARRYFTDGRVLGRRILVQASNQALAEIVGVVGDVHHNGLTSDPVPTVFLLHAQTPGYITNLVVRTTGDPMAHAAAIRRAIHEADPTQAVSAVGTLDEAVAKILARPRLQATLVASFAVIAVGLAVIGVYGLIAYVVTQRTQEIGIRLALGATSRRIFSELFSEGAWLVIGGLAIGVGAAVLLRRLVATLVFGVTPGDPLTYSIAALVFLGVALVGVAIPARRGSRVEPVSALRGE
jgi:putative ABC transport system permease protein